MRRSLRPVGFITYDKTDGMPIEKYSNFPPRKDNEVIVRFDNRTDLRIAWVRDLKLMVVDRFGGRVVS